jgi:aminopeptidase-like protein
MSDNPEPGASASEPMHRWVSDLFPIARSLTGPGVRETLAYLQRLLPGLATHSVKSGTKAFDWTVPDEWAIRDAWIADEAGNRLVDFRRSNLHVVGYSTPIEGWFTREELDSHLHSLPAMPDAIPYVTSYYARNWGFCLTQRQRDALGAGRYFVKIDSDLKPGVLNYGELILPGREESEILLSTYVCHPSLANNELSGPVVTTALARWLQARTDRRYTYRIVFVPETIGSIVYLSRHLGEMRKRVIAGFVLTCVGDDRAYSFLPSRRGNSRADRAARQAFKDLGLSPVEYSFLDRGSDERQYCSPGVDLPVCSIMRSKYGIYPEYHTSLDDLTLVTQKGLEGALAVHRRAIEVLEDSRIYRAVHPCEPQLGKRGLYPAISTRESGALVRTMMNLLAYADGESDLLTIAETIGAGVGECETIAETLRSHGLLEIVGSGTLRSP